MIGEDILKPVLLGPEMLAAVRGHHERHDGNGYPDKLAGEDIHVFARILSVADAYDAMTSKRLYRQVLSQESAVAELRKHSGTQFDPQIVDIFIAILKERKSAAS
jgi:HD-GYP domain-containing protein (c-di-GMP phosphodiesterase class II)